MVGPMRAEQRQQRVGAGARQAGADPAEVDERRGIRVTGPMCADQEDESACRPPVPAADHELVPAAALGFSPCLGPAGDVGRVLTFMHHTLKPKLAGRLQHRLPGRIKVGEVANTGHRGRDHGLERGLAFRQWAGAPIRVRVGVAP